ncbi:WD40 repeat domain-containing protein [Alloactinosynnema sp. L-07]|uniref:NACHT and WD repeat domain-containing protein n=1 Tax=Alloactinosynnema sp. L-07 TaxID=1653480 RepID=UPI0015605D66|nr:WD40 repeat domain-containing protein [Alloactinosynnema sp. L-07]
MASQLEYRHSLKNLMAWAGYRTLQQLQAGAERRGVPMPSSTANRALNADKLPTADFVCRFVAACGGDVARWIDVRDRLVDRRYAVDQPPTTDDDPAGEVCPYPGLAPFQTTQAEWYFGRERVVADLVTRLTERLDDRSPLFVVGPSGVGKSSLLRAGLVPALQQGRFPGSRTWRHLVMTPTAHPVRELTRQVATMFDTEQADVEDRLRQAPDRLWPTDETVVVVVDQFEELFTHCADEAERALFVSALRSPAVVVLALRADFYGHCTAYPEFVSALRRGHLPLGAMSAAELRAVIEKPAAAVGMTVENGLAELMLAELGAEDVQDGRRYEPGALPLLSHSLFATWQQRDGNALTLAGYRLTGGLRGAIAASAENAFQRLDDHSQAAAKRLLLRMIQIGDGTDDTRLGPDRARLVGETDDPTADESVLEALAGARLVTLSANRAEIAHDIVLRAWPRLRAWIDGDRTRLLVRQRVADAARQWDREGRHDSDLYRQPRLGASSQWVNPSDPDLLPTTREFLTESVRREHSQRRVRRRRGLLAVGLTVAVAIAAAVAVESYQDASRQRDIAAAQVAAYEAIALRSGDADLAGQVSLAAFRMAPVAETRGSLISGLVTPNPTQLSTGNATDAVRSVAFSADGRVLAASKGSVILRFDVADPLNPKRLPNLEGHAKTVRSLAYRPDNQWIAATGEDGAVLLWDLATPAVPIPVANHANQAYTVVFGDRGNLLASASLDTTTRLWDVRDPRNPSLLTTITHPHAVFGVAISPDGRLLATAGQSDTVRLWDITEPREPRQLSHLVRHSGYVNTVGFAPDGRTLVSTGTDATARLWDITDPRRPVHLAVLTGHTAPVHGAAFSPDGHALVTTSVDVTARLWDITDPARPTVVAAPLTGHTDNVYSASFHPDGHTLATGSHDRTVKTWETDVERVAARVCAPTRPRMTSQDWAQYFPGYHFTPPCP